MITFPTIQELNTASEADYIATMRLLFEDAPELFALIRQRKPFKTYEQLFTAADDILHNEMSHDTQIAILDAHPRLGETKANLSVLSSAEQGAENALVDARLMELNRAYEKHYGFRFVYFVNKNPRKVMAHILEEILNEERLPSDELHRGLSHMVFIAESRYLKLLQAS